MGFYFPPRKGNWSKKASEGFTSLGKMAYVDMTL